MLFSTKTFTRMMALGLGLFILGLLSQYAYAHGMSDAEKLSILQGGNLSYLWLGASHMLSGYDHLAFVFGIIFFLTSFNDIVKYITAFTLGHSVTLIYATFNGIQMNYFFIDAVIGLSVCYIAFANIDGFRKYLGIQPPNMMLMITGLGFIHGFGLSTRLQELPLSEDSLLLNIVSFNAGIELGQIGALSLMLLLIAAWRKRPTFQGFSLLANYGLILTGGLLFLMQMHGYAHSGDQAEFTPPAQAAEEIGQQVNAAAQAVQPVPWKDTIQITLEGRGDKEYKFYLEKDARLDYAWQTDGPELFFDLHGEPTGDTTGYFKSLQKNTLRQASGSFTTEFEGPHGWYFKNNSPLPVTITLKAKGDYQRLDVEKALEEKALEDKPQEKKKAGTHETIDSF